MVGVVDVVDGRDIEEVVLSGDRAHSCLKIRTCSIVESDSVF